MASQSAFVEDSFQNARGHTIRTQHLLPADKPRAIAVLAHGYAHYGLGFAKNFQSLPAEHGIAVFAMDHEGHGFSHGLKGYVKLFSHLVDDFGQYVRAVAGKYPGVPIFIMGESMGGAITLMSTLEGGPLHGFVSGLILLAPMCKIADNLKPPEWQIKMLRGIARMGPTWPIAPVPDVLPLCFKDRQKYLEVRQDRIAYHGKPRLRTALELYYATLSIAERIPTVSVPFLLLHGGADRVTDPAISKELYETAASTDKTFKLYDGMWHGILAEPDGGAEMVIADVVQWIKARITAVNSPAAASVVVHAEL